MIVNRHHRRQAREMFALACEGGRVVPERVREVAEGFLASNPRGAAATLSEFARLVRLDLARRHAVIESATPLPLPAQSRLLEALAQKYGPGLTSEFRVRPELVGGVRVQVGSDVWDASILGRLESLARQF
ncbi:MAG: F0F1 ATP synthase subunit delta [Terrimicrobiaceae bacterium]|nr:F0F1 ATP synthase subunit delta [Terrimicrobiaceae bacterium]